MRKKRTRGVAAVEFALLTPFWLVLLIGTFTIGTQLVWELQVTQLVRDLASMYARGVDFSLSANQQLVTRLGVGLGLQPTGGNGVIILSTVEYLDSTCNCNNANSWVFLNRIAFGDTSLRQSSWGTTCTDLDAEGNVPLTEVTGSACAQVSSSFTQLGTPSAAANGFKPGQPAYIAEAYAKTGLGNGDYAYAIF